MQRLPPVSAGPAGVRRVRAGRGGRRHATCRARATAAANVPKEAGIVGERGNTASHVQPFVRSPTPDIPHPDDLSRRLRLATRAHRRLAPHATTSLGSRVCGVTSKGLSRLSARRCSPRWRSDPTLSGSSHLPPAGSILAVVTKPPIGTPQPGRQSSKSLSVSLSRKLSR